MVHARLVCSEPVCGVLYEAFGPLEEIEALACECGCGLELLTWPVPLGGRGSLELLEISG